MDDFGMSPEPRPIRHVLVVDDLPEIGDLFRGMVRHLRDVDLRMTTEANSAKALDLVRETPFDLVVSDYRMPHVDGAELLKAHHGRSPEGFRILMTGYNEIPTSEERLREAHIDFFLQKPLRTQDVLSLLRDLVEDGPRATEARRRRGSPPPAGGSEGPPA